MQVERAWSSAWSVSSFGRLGKADTVGQTLGSARLILDRRRLGLGIGVDGPMSKPSFRLSQPG